MSLNHNELKYNKIKIILIMSIMTALVVLAGCTNRDGAESENVPGKENNAYQEQTDIDELVLHERIEKRRHLSVDEALKGMWIEENGTIIRFTDEHFMQGEELEHVFSYEMKEKMENEMHMSLYGVEGFMVKDRNMFELNVVMDETRSQMILQKDIGGKVYVYHLVYLDVDGVKLSSFGTQFFSESE
jgi:hypothetical protein